MVTIYLFLRKAGCSGCIVGLLVVLILYCWNLFNGMKCVLLLVRCTHSLTVFYTYKCGLSL